MMRMLKISAVHLIGNPKRVTLSASISENPVPFCYTWVCNIMRHTVALPSVEKLTEQKKNKRNGKEDRFYLFTGIIQGK